MKLNFQYCRLKFLLTCKVSTTSHTPGVILFKRKSKFAIPHALKSPQSLLKSYLYNRSQKCQINGVMSSAKNINCGVPQGSILRPLFFLLYINDLPQCLSKTKPRLFADDMNLTASGESINQFETTVNSDLENLRKWLIASLNVAKTEFMVIGSKLRTISNWEPKVDIENEHIKQVSECKTLGVTQRRLDSKPKSIMGNELLIARAASVVCRPLRSKHLPGENKCTLWPEM